jgi:hypothetical protein
MTIDQLPRIVSVVRQCLQNAQQPLSFSELLECENLRVAQITPIFVRHAIWYLVNQGVVNFTADWRLKLNLCEEQLQAREHGGSI